eukprot:6802650-Alexandrium_andersonii.AAC.1
MALSRHCGPWACMPPRLRCVRQRAEWPNARRPARRNTACPRQLQAAGNSPSKRPWASACTRRSSRGAAIS